MRDLATSVDVDQCNISSFICPNNISTIEEQINNCSYNSQCSICNETDCNFGETVFKRCGGIFIFFFKF